MPVIQFHGIVMSDRLIGKQSGQGSWDDPDIQGVLFSFDITDSVISVVCETQTPNQVPVAHLYLRAYLMARGCLDVLSFANGTHFAFVINEITYEDGHRDAWFFDEIRLAELCTVSVREIYGLANRERAILKHLHELSATIVNPLDSESNCHRAVEGFAQLLAPTVNEKQRWKKMQSDLNLTESYIKFITDLSKGPRHGATDPQSLPHIMEVRRRAWMIANRFLEFRKRRSDRLTAPDFPLL
jgi:hypothetical protein